LTIAGGSVVKAILVAVSGFTATAVLAAVVRDREVSVAVRVQARALSTASLLKVATPATAVATVVPPRAHEEEMVTTSVAPSPVVITLPNESSTETLKVASDDPALAVVGGCVVKASLVAEPGLTVTDVLVAGVRYLDVSLPVRVQAPVSSILSALNVAMPPLAVATVVPPRAHEEEMVMESVKSVVAGALVPSSIKTLNVARVAPATVVVGGWVVKASLVACAADAGEAETKINPVVKIVEHAPRVRTADSVERTDLRPPSRFITFFMDDSLV
jgi:hypothetical protein